MKEDAAAALVQTRIAQLVCTELPSIPDAWVISRFVDPRRGRFRREGHRDGSIEEHVAQRSGRHAVARERPIAREVVPRRADQLRSRIGPVLVGRVERDGLGHSEEPFVLARWAIVKPTGWVPGGDASANSRSMALRASAAVSGDRKSVV